MFEDIIRGKFRKILQSSGGLLESYNLAQLSLFHMYILQGLYKN